MTTRRKQMSSKRGWQSSSFFRESIFDRIQNLFELCDQQSKGFVTLQELFLLKNEIALTDDEIRTAFRILDTDKNGQLSLDEFSAGFGVFLGIDKRPSKVKKPRSTDDNKEMPGSQARQLFDILDKDHKGYVSRADLMRIASDINITENDIDAIFQKLGYGSKILTFEEFAEGWDRYLRRDYDSPLIARKKSIQSENNNRNLIMDLTEYDQDEVRVLLKQKATELFKICDKDNKNYISKEDLLALTKELALTKDQVESAFDKLDTDRNKFLTLDEFVEGFGLFLGVENEEENDPLLQAKYAKIHELFELCDQGSKGYVTKSDLRRLSSELELSADQINEIFDSLDEDANGFLTIYEFMQGFSHYAKDIEDGLFVRSPAGSVADADLPLTSGEYRDVALQNSAQIYRLKSMEVLDSDARSMLDDIGENLLADALTKEQLQDLWKSLSKNDTITLSKFEEFLFKVVGEIKKAKTEAAHLENTLRRRALSHDMEVQRLYEEMEQQIKIEKSKIREKELKKEKVMREELVKELEEKEVALQKMVSQQKTLEKKLRDIQLAETDLRCENSKLLQENMDLEDQLNDSMSSLEETKQYIVKLHEVSVLEKKEKAKVAMQATEGMAKEHESLIHQLDLLREMNQKLRDDRDTIEQSLKEQTINGRPKSISDEIEAMEGLYQTKPEKRKLTREGSNMSKYFVEGKLGFRAESEKSSTSISSRGKLEKQGSIMSKYFGADCLPRIKNSISSTLKGTHAYKYLAYAQALIRGSQENIIEAVNEEGEDVFDGSEAIHTTSRPKFRANTMEALHETEEESGRQSRRDSGINSPQTKINDSQLSAAEDEENITVNHAEEVMTSTPLKHGEDLSNDVSVIHSIASKENSLSRTEPIGTEGEVTSSQTTNSTLPVELPPENPNRVYKVVFIGDSGVGKSSFIHRLCFGAFLPNFSATIGVDFQVKTMKIAQQWVALQLWDTAGQERFRSITRQYFRKADGVVIMYDVCSESSFKNMRGWMESVEEGAGPECTVMVLGNKKDLVHDARSRNVKKSAISRFVKDYSCLYEETSAKSGVGVLEAITKLAQVLEEKEDSRLQSHILNLEMSPAETERKKGCCGR